MAYVITSVRRLSHISIFFEFAWHYLKLLKLKQNVHSHFYSFFSPIIFLIMIVPLTMFNLVWLAKIQLTSNKTDLDLILIIISLFWVFLKKITLNLLFWRTYLSAQCWTYFSSSWPPIEVAFSLIVTSTQFTPMGKYLTWCVTHTLQLIKLSCRCDNNNLLLQHRNKKMHTNLSWMYPNPCCL